MTNDETRPVAKASLGALASPALFAAMTGATMLLQGRGARAALAFQAEEADKARAFAYWQQKDAQAHQERLVTRQALANIAQHGAAKEIEQEAASWPLENPPRHVLADVEAGCDGLTGHRPLVLLYAAARESAEPAFIHAFESAVRTFAQGPLGGVSRGVLALDGWRAGRGFNTMAVSALRRGLPGVPFLVLNLCSHPGGGAELLAAYESGHGVGPVEVRALGDGKLSLRDVIIAAGREEVELRTKARRRLLARGIPGEAVDRLFGSEQVEEALVVDAEKVLAAEGFPIDRLGLARRLATPDRYLEEAPAALVPVLQMVVGFFVDGHRLLQDGEPPCGLAELPRLCTGLAPALAPNVDHLIGAYDNLLSAVALPAAAGVPARLRLARAALSIRGADRARPVVERALHEWLDNRGSRHTTLSDAPTVIESLAVTDDAPVVELFSVVLSAVGVPAARKLGDLARRLRAEQA